MKSAWCEPEIRDPQKSTGRQAPAPRCPNNPPSPPPTRAGREGGRGAGACRPHGAQYRTAPGRARRRRPGTARARTRSGSGRPAGSPGNEPFRRNHPRRPGPAPLPPPSPHPPASGFSTRRAGRAGGRGGVDPAPPRGVRGSGFRPVLKHGPRSLTYARAGQLPSCEPCCSAPSSLG